MGKGRRSSYTFFVKLILHECCKLLENGCCWRMDAAGEWMLLESGCCWRVDAAGEWMLLESGCCWRIDAAEE
ncbi:uncharacterized protein EKO05_0004184 [Ascochyta rabiei]|uniref:uncharacterized protein n=1 Tax=Didymella rabiei TaxID=5454 RepID=UPI0021FBB107|nr:uncharacterized protein EKO05_0004184 [Ascochyta rabiei]UPX13685.1 hypothetical protein EKO05_0004184 [Ascochyta rabiei]